MGKAGLLELQSQWVRSATAGKKTLKPGFLSHGGVRVASVIFRQDTPCNEQGQGTNGGPKHVVSRSAENAGSSKQGNTCMMTEIQYYPMYGCNGLCRLL